MAAENERKPLTDLHQVIAIIKQEGDKQEEEHLQRADRVERRFLQQGLRIEDAPLAVYLKHAFHLRQANACAAMRENLIARLKEKLA